MRYSTDRDQGSTVANDVAQQLEERKNQHKQHEADQHHDKGTEKLTQNVPVENERKASPFMCRRSSSVRRTGLVTG